MSASRVRQGSTTTGTGALTLNISADDTHFTFASVADLAERRFFYCIKHDVAGQVEIGVGSYDSGTNELNRLAVIRSSNDDDLVDFLSGNKDIYVTNLAEMISCGYVDNEVTLSSGDFASDSGYSVFKVRSESGSIDQLDAITGEGVQGQRILLWNDNDEVIEILESATITVPNKVAQAIPKNTFVELVYNGTKWALINREDSVPLETTTSEYIVKPSVKTQKIEWFGDGLDFAAGTYSISYLGGSFKNSTNGWAAAGEDMKFVVCYDDTQAVVIDSTTPQETQLAAKQIIFDSLANEVEIVTTTTGPIGIFLLLDKSGGGSAMALAENIEGNPSPVFALEEVV